VKNFRSRLGGIGFRARLTIVFIALIMLSLTVMTVGYITKSSDVILHNASETYLGFVRMSNQSVDAELARVENSAINMHLDSELFLFFNDANLQRKENDNESDRKITRILQKYFPSSEHLFSVNLVTREFTFGETPSFWIPKRDYSQHNIYRIGQQSITRTEWIPTYNMLEQFYATGPTDSGQNVFTAARSMNFATVRNNLLIQMEKNIERPVLIVNYQESLLQEALGGSLTVDGSYYRIFAEDGTLVSSSASSEDAGTVNKAWLTRALGEKSGTEYITLNGKKMVVCYDTMKVTGWLSAVFIPYDNLLQTVPNMMEYTIYSMVLIGMSAIILASYLSGRITLPLKKLMYGINRMGDGNFTTRIEPTGTMEVNQIIRKFNQMNGNIQTLIEENYKTHIREMEAELKALNFQFNPHFLYNTLNIINYLAIENKQALISKMLVSLSEMLTYTAKSPRKVIFFEDVKYLENYVYIMNQRFENKFQVTYDFDPVLFRYDVPKFFLQPFIENAIIHGFEDIEEGGRIQISGEIRDKDRIFTISDNGKGMGQATIQRVLLTNVELSSLDSSIGIENVNQRIRLLYGTEYGVSIHSVMGRGTTITLRLPLE